MKTIEKVNTVAQSLNISKDIQSEGETLIALRRQIHQNPGLSFKEYKTQALVLSCLADWRIDAQSLAGTGVVATICGQNPGKVLLLRGDMDALPIEEQSAVSWKSSVPGVMHACGHDAHTAMMLIAAKILNRRGLKNGAVKFMFQPAEEGGGGAKAMLDAGVLDNPKVDAAVGFHIWTGYEIGCVAVPAGPVTASVDGFRMTITGKGTHAAAPENGADPIFVAAQIVTAAQGLVTRKTRAMDPVVLSFTSIKGGSAFNIIPETAEILGTLRTFNTEVRNRLRDDLIRLSKNLAEVFGATVHYETFTEDVPMTSDLKIAALALEAAEQVVGKSGIIFPDPLMVGEDFAEVLSKVPGAFVMLGCGNEAVGAIYPHHHPQFTIDEQVLTIGVEIAVRTAEAFLEA